MLVLRGSLTESRLILRRQTSQYAVKDEAMEERALLSPSLPAPAQKWAIWGTDFFVPSVFLCLIITLRLCLLPSVWIWKPSYCPHAQNCCLCESLSITLVIFSELLLCLLCAFSVEQFLIIFLGYFLCLFENDLGSFRARTLGWL